MLTPLPATEPPLRMPVHSAAIPASCEPSAVAALIPSRTMTWLVKSFNETRPDFKLGSVGPVANGANVWRKAPAPDAPVNGLVTTVEARCGPCAPQRYRTTPHGVKRRTRYCGGVLCCAKEGRARKNG